MSPSLNAKIKIGRRSGSDVVGLDIQPGLIAAAQVRVNGAILAEQAAAAELPADAMREGDVADPAAVTQALRELFASSRLGKRVRVGVANQRTVMRTLELPPVSDAKELAAAVRFQAQDQIPMPLASAVMDFHALGVVDTPAGPRQKVVVVAAQRDMIDRLLTVVRGAGLTPVGIDLSAFALIRSLHTSAPEAAGRVLYLNVDGLTNLAIAEGTVCHFTRVVGGGFEEMVLELAERRGVPLTEARALLAAVDLSASEPEEASLLRRSGAGPEDPTEVHASDPSDAEGEQVVSSEPAEDQLDIDALEADAASGDVAHEEPETGAPYPRKSPSEHAGAAPLTEPPPAPSDASQPNDSEARLVLENGVRAISGEVRNSLDFHRSQGGGADVTHVVLSGLVLDLPGFTEALQASLGVDVHPAAVALADESLAGRVSTHRLAVAAGLAAAEVPQ
jgi:type IV pilus assembly protein PilM